MKISLKVAVASLSLIAAMPSQATLIDFNGLARDGGGIHYLSDRSLTFGDYKFTAKHDLANPFLVFGRSAVANADPGGATLVHQWGETTMTLARTDGGLFDLIGFNFADLFNYGGQNQQELLFEYGNGKTETRLFTTDNLAGFQYLLLNRTGLRQVSFTPRSNGWWQIDNVSVEAAAAVPEPATWMMLISGFAFAGFCTRRRKLAVEFAR
ncbi:MAG: PEPxxWA-CTERM sorting domain-containing protein [Sphingomonadales bacterium]|nr:PEPxxWA-CTERM sorting domain-containing protein [Sphingomonadales bacterium]